MSRKSPAELKVENRLLRRFNIVSETFSTINNIVRWGAIVLIVYFVYRSIAVLSGKTTFADVGVNFLADIRVSEGLAWILAGSSAIYGWQQRSLRKKTIERLQPRIAKYESEKDSGRTSSQLTTRGDTRPEDKR